MLRSTPLLVQKSAPPPRLWHSDRYEPRKAYGQRGNASDALQTVVGLRHNERCRNKPRSYTSETLVITFFLICHRSARKKEKKNPLTLNKSQDIPWICDLTVESYVVYHGSAYLGWLPGISCMKQCDFLQIHRTIKICRLNGLVVWHLTCITTWSQVASILGRERERDVTEAGVSDGVLGQEVAAHPVNCQCR